MRRRAGRKPHSATVRPTRWASPRIVKVFISSTFRDFQKERDELVKKTFPALRDYCTRRHIVFIDVDLRWGITEEQAEAGEILPICLAEIDHCRPFFIGLLGERYGWIPGHIPVELIAQQPWLREHQQKSITELEILHGAIRNSAMQGRRFFYFRSPAYPQGLPPAEQSDYGCDDAAATGKLERLKELIRNEAKHNRLKLVESYPDPARLAELVGEDLKEAIAADFPEEEYDELENEKLAHQTFVDARASILVERPALLEDLIRRLSGPSLPVVVSGASGSGKTSLLVSLALKLGERYPQACLFTNFVGVSANSTDYSQIIQRLLVEILDRQDSDEEIPEGCAERVAYFSGFFAKLPAQPVTFVLLDGLDQIADVEEALAYRWLPERFPDHVRLVVSVSSPAALEIFSKRGWPVLEVSALTPAEQRQIIVKYLGRYGKRLDAAQSEIILGAQQASSPLYLRALLEEIRIFGDFARLNDRIRHYLASRDAVDLYDKILERLEADYERQSPGLVRRAFSLLAASRHGLTETELRDMLGVPQAIWSPLHLAVRESLSNTMGYLTFFHEYLWKAVDHRYLATQEARRAMHRCLADHFTKSEDIDRKADELPWQLMKAEEWGWLRDCLSQFDIFLNLRQRDGESELLNYWKILQPHYSVAATYTQALRGYAATNPEQDRLRFRMKSAAEFLIRCGFVREAAALQQKIKQLDDETFKVEYLGELQDSRVDNLLALAVNLAEAGEFEPAEAVLRQAQSILDKMPGQKSAEHARILNSLAFAQKNMKRYEEAERNYRAAIALDPLPAYTNNLATLLQALGQSGEAERLYRGILDRLPENDNLRAVVLGNLGDLLLHQGRENEAAECYQGAIQISRDRLGPSHFQLAVHLCRYADVLLRRREPSEAEQLVAEAISIFTAALGPDHPRTKDACQQRKVVNMFKAVHESFLKRKASDGRPPA